MSNLPGVSGMSLYVPPLRVSLQDWCEWYGQPWEKVNKVVGSGFRMLHPQQDAYILAANAVLRLIKAYDIDPHQVGMLVLATESSQDNAIGAVIVRGLVDQALRSAGMPVLARGIEVPEIKQACIAGIYGIQNAVRYLATDGQDKVAIVVAADVAEYPRGSSGEQTQGAGAVAALIEPDAKMFRLDLHSRGDASAYRGPDFRKPLHRHHMDAYQTSADRYHDFPVFSGRYSTYAYIDATLNAFKRHVAKSDQKPLQLLEKYHAVFFHRPYRYMPIQGLSYLYLYGLLNEDQSELLSKLCVDAQVDLQLLRAEVDAEPDLLAHLEAHGADTPPYPLLDKLASLLRRHPAFKDYVAQKTSLGSQTAAEFGNLYSAALSAWLAAGFDDAAKQGKELADQSLLAIGYGSGDAALAMAVQPVPGWQIAAAKIDCDGALQNVRNINRNEYESLHDHGCLDDDLLSPVGCRIAKLGEVTSGAFQDIGVPYYHAGMSGLISDS